MAQMKNGMKYLKTYTACPRCGQALELSPDAETEIDKAVKEAIQKERQKITSSSDNRSLEGL
jgi:hypothetical protein